MSLSLSHAVTDAPDLVLHNGNSTVWTPIAEQISRFLTQNVEQKMRPVLSRDDGHL